MLDLVRRDPHLGETVVPGRPHLLAEAAYAVRNEMAVHVEDVLFRRTRVGLETRDETPEAARRLAKVMAAELGWSDEQQAEEVRRAMLCRSADDEAIRELATRGMGVA